LLDLARMRVATIATASCLALAAAACAGPVGEPDPGEIGAAVDDALRGIASGTTTETEIAYRIVDLHDTTLAGSISPATCDSVDAALDSICGDLVDARQAIGCSRITAFYFAHAVPRCGVRLYLHNADTLARVYALDFTGVPIEGPAPTCGNGQLDDGETCDDGNFELWDGCDSNCQIEELVGCESVIELAYSVAGIARVDATTWQARRSQLMVNDATAMQPVTAELCTDAGALVTSVCDELRAQMPFVRTCGGTHHFDAAAGPGCAVRFEVGFGSPSPDAGVFTTAMTGILAFTIR
jgi:cysteine-rich repeat protein